MEDILLTIGIFLWFTLALLVGRDSSIRGHRNGILWLLFVLVTGIFGTIIYLLVRKPHPDSMVEAVETGHETKDIHNN